MPPRFHQAHRGEKPPSLRRPIYRSQRLAHYSEPTARVRWRSCALSVRKIFYTRGDTGVPHVSRFSRRGCRQLNFAQNFLPAVPRTKPPLSHRVSGGTAQAFYFSFCRPFGAYPCYITTHGWRRGLHSCAAPRLASGIIGVLRLKPCLFKTKINTSHVLVITPAFAPPPTSPPADPVQSDSNYLPRRPTRTPARRTSRNKFRIYLTCPRP